ncbi:hypothetical protein P8452_53453 [Trifolium repens]|nr:hypothetical protein P8452_53453 [Trifolium repens]
MERVGSLHKLWNRAAVVTNACRVENAKEIVNVAETIALLEQWSLTSVNYLIEFLFYFVSLVIDIGQIIGRELAQRSSSEHLADVQLINTLSLLVTRVIF